MGMNTTVPAPDASDRTKKKLGAFHNAQEGRKIGRSDILRYNPFAPLLPFLCKKSGMADFGTPKLSFFQLGGVS